MTNARYKRIIGLTTYLTSHRGQQVSLTELSHKFGVAKSTLSDDLMMVKGVCDEMQLGTVVTQVGVQGGVEWRSRLNPDATQAGLDFWVKALADPDRRTPEGFLYMTDLLFDPGRIQPVAELLASKFLPLQVDAVATVETKGIGLALATAERLGVGVVLLRRDSRLSDGSALSLNYLSGSSHRIQSMSLSRRTRLKDARLVFVDDFMKAGGTARAAQDLLSEFDARVVGVGVMVATTEPYQKVVDDYVACIEWSDGGRAATRFSISPWVRDHLRSVRKMPSSDSS